jgi:hypothetical protein
MSFSPLFRRSLAISAALALGACSTSNPPNTLTVLSTSPDMNAVNVPVGTEITVVFNAVPTAATLVLSPSVDLTPTFRGAQVTWTHAAAFAEGIKYTATLSAASAADDTLPLASAVSWSFTTVSPVDHTPPARITDLAAANAMMSTVALSWTAPGNDGNVGNAISYQLRYASGAGCPMTAANFATAHAITTSTPQPAGSHESAIAGGLTANTTYCFGIEATDQSGNASPLSNIVTASTTTTADITPPAAVTNLAAGGNGLSTIHLTWTAPADNSGNVASYDLRQASGSACPISDANFATSTPIPTGTPKAAGSAESADATGLFATTTYCYAIKSIDGAGNLSNISNIATASTLSPAAGAIANLVVQSVSGEQVTLSYSAPVHSDAGGTYDIYTAPGACPADASTFIASSSGHLSGIPAGASGTTETHTVTALNPSSQYCIGVTFTDNGSTTAISNLVSANTGDDIPPATVAVLSVGIVTSSSVALSFTAPGDNGKTGNVVTSYDLRYATTSAADCGAFNYATATRFPTPGPYASPGAAQTFTVTGLAASTHYCFALTATDAAGNKSATSAVASATTPAPDNNAPPAKVVDLAIANATNTSIQLNFTAPGQHDSQGTVGSYDLRYSVVPNGTTNCGAFDYSSATHATFTDAIVAAGGAQMASVTGLARITTYCFGLTASDGNGHISQLSNEVVGNTVDQSAPDVPTLTLVSTPADHSVTLSTTAPNPNDLNASASAVSYDLRFLTGAVCSTVAPNFASGTAIPVAAPGTPGATDTFVLTGLVANTQYCFGLAAADATGNRSLYSDKVLAQTAVDSTPPDAVTDLALVHNVNQVTLTFTLTGDDGKVGAPFQTQLYSLGGAACPITAANFATATLLDNKLSPGKPGDQQTYVESTSQDVTCYAVTVSDAAGNVSAVSNSALYVQNGPTAPTNFAATSVGTTALTLKWVDGSGDGTSIPAATSYAAGYKVAADCSGFTLAGATSLNNLPAPQAVGTAETFSVSGLTPKTSYCFGLAGVDQFGNTSPLALLPVTTQESGTSGISAVRAAIASASASPVTFATPITITNAVVSYVKATAPQDAGVPDTTGFFLQNDTGGPALYISIDPATFLGNTVLADGGTSDAGITPALAAGDIVTLSATTGAWSGCSPCTALNSEYIVTAATGMRVGVGGAAAIPGSLSLDTTDVIIPDGGILNWPLDEVMVKGAVTLTGAFASSGTGFQAATGSTLADPDAGTNLVLRVPTTLITSAGLEKACVVTLNGTPLARFGNATSNKTELAAYYASDFTASCPAPTLASSTPGDGSTTASQTPTIQLNFDTPMNLFDLATDTAGNCSGNVKLAAQATPASCIPLPSFSQNATDTVFTSGGALALAANTTYLLTITGAQANNGNALATKTVTFTTANPAVCSSNDLVLSQIYGGGGNSGSTLTNDFIELHNRGSIPVDLTSLSVQYQGSTGTTWAFTALPSQMLAAGAFFTIREAKGSAGTTATPADFPTGTAAGLINLSASAGKVALASTNTSGTAIALSSQCPTTGIIDLVQFGTNTNACAEGSAAPATSDNVGSIVRGANACTDTNNNSNDFSVQSTAAPRLQTSSTQVCSCPGN